MRNLKILIRRIVRNLKETWKNKLVAIFFAVIGIPFLILDNDITILVLFGLLAIPMFFTRKNLFFRD